MDVVILRTIGGGSMTNPATADLQFTQSGSYAAADDAYFRWTAPVLNTSGGLTYVGPTGAGTFQGHIINLISDSSIQLFDTRTFQISGDGTATAQNFNGTQNVNLNLSMDPAWGLNVDSGGIDNITYGSTVNINAGSNINLTYTAGTNTLEIATTGLGTMSSFIVSGSGGGVNQTITDGNTLLFQEATGISIIGVNTDVIEIGLEHLGLENLSGPGADRFLIWDQSAGSTAWMNFSTTNFSISATPSLTTNDIDLAGDAGTGAVNNGGTLTLQATPSNITFTASSSQWDMTASTPTAGGDLTTKTYVDNLVQGLDAKDSVVATTTGNITLSGLTTQGNGDWGGALTAGDRILVKNQTAPEDNGIYEAAAGAWARAADMDAWDEVPGAFTFVEEGSTLADTGWVSTADDGGTLGTTDITWVQFSSAGSYTGGNHITLNGNAFDHDNAAAVNTTVGSLLNSPTFLTRLRFDSFGHVVDAATDTLIAADIGAMTAWLVDADTGIGQTPIQEGIELNFTGGTGIDTVISGASPYTIEFSLTNTGFTLNGDAGTGSVDLGETWSITGSGGITTNVTGTTITIDASSISTTFTAAGDTGNNQTISSGDTLTIVGGTGIATAGGAVSSDDINVSLSHLGLEGLTGPGADRIFFYDQSGGGAEWLVANTGIEISGTNLNVNNVPNASLTNSGFALASGANFTGSDSAVNLGETLTMVGAGGITGTISNNQIQIDGSGVTGTTYTGGEYIDITGTTVDLGGAATGDVTLTMANSTAGQVFKWNDQNTQDVLTLNANNGTNILTLEGAFYAIEKHFDIVDPRQDDPNVRLIHGVLEGPENGVYYRGEANVSNGATEIILPDYFTALASSNGATVQVTQVYEGGEFIQVASSKVEDGKFTIYSNGAGKVNWHVTAERIDIDSLEVEVTR